MKLAAIASMIPPAAACYKDYSIVITRRTCQARDTELSHLLRTFVSMPKINAQRSNKYINYRYDSQDNLTPHHFLFCKCLFPSVFAWNFPIAPCRSLSIIHIVKDNTNNIIPKPTIFKLVVILSLRPWFPGASSA